MSDGPKNDNNVYILGAGFSMLAGVPGARAFLNKVRDAYAWIEEKGLPGEHEAVRKLLDFRRQCAASAERARINLENIEDLFSLAAADEGPAATSYLPLALAATIRYSLETAQKKTINITFDRTKHPHWAIPKEWREDTGRRSEARSTFGAPVYHGLAGVMTGALAADHQGTDTVITFNYDLLVEDAARALRMNIDYGLPPSAHYAEPNSLSPKGHERTATILKLHGSCNWKASTDGISVYSSYENLLAAGGTPHLIPPTWQKFFTDAEGHVWAKAVSALRSATRVFVIGFSLPATDLHFKYLLAAGFKSNSDLRELTFVNPDPAVRARCHRVLRKDLEESGVLRFVKDYAEDFMLRPGDFGRAVHAAYQLWPSVYATTETAG